MSPMDVNRTQYNTISVAPYGFVLVVSISPLEIWANPENDLKGSQGSPRLFVHDKIWEVLRFTRRAILACDLL